MVPLMVAARAASATARARMVGGPNAKPRAASVSAEGPMVAGRSVRIATKPSSMPGSYVRATTSTTTSSLAVRQRVARLSRWCSQCLRCRRGDSRLLVGSLRDQRSSPALAPQRSSGSRALRRSQHVHWRAFASASHELSQRLTRATALRRRMRKVPRLASLYRSLASSPLQPLREQRARQLPLYPQHGRLLRLHSKRLHVPHVSGRRALADARRSRKLVRAREHLPRRGAELSGRRVLHARITVTRSHVGAFCGTRGVAGHVESHGAFIARLDAPPLPGRAAQPTSCAISRVRCRGERRHCVDRRSSRV